MSREPMKQETIRPTAKTKQDKVVVTSSIGSEIRTIALLMAGILLIIAMMFPNSTPLFRFLHGTFLGLVGFGAYLLPIAIITTSVLTIMRKEFHLPLIQILFLFWFFLAFLALVNPLPPQLGAPRTAFEYMNHTFYRYVDYDGRFLLGVMHGGIFGAIPKQLLSTLIGRAGAIIVILGLIIIFSVLVSGRSFIHLVQQNFKRIKNYYNQRADVTVEYEEEVPVKRRNKSAPNKPAPQPPTRPSAKITPRPRHDDFVRFEDELDEDLVNDDELILMKDEDFETRRIERSDTILFSPRKKSPKQKGEIIQFQPKQEYDYDDEHLPDPVDYEEDSFEEDGYDFTVHGLVSEPAESAVVPEPALVSEPAVEEEELPAHKNYKMPHFSLLAVNEKQGTESHEQVKANSKILEETLKSFKIYAKVVDVSVGPSVTRYDLSPGPGVKVSAIVKLSNDLALSLAAQGIRIEAPIPGKSAVGIEIPNKEPQAVFLREIIEDLKFELFPSKLAFAVGKDIAGDPVVADLSGMPHLLIAGTTGSGKSVCINTLIISILYKAHPDEVKLLMIDPKVVELSIYNGIPHLLIPVITDPKKASGALIWAVQEMETRYQLFAAADCRDLETYNVYAKMEEENELPQIVIIIDELADLIMVAKSEVEESICRLAQKARAAGIHLVVATQRPSVDVITGLIKANIPSRLAFAVSSGTDSRTILDIYGAEKLLGKGDMLFLPMGQNKPIRVQGSYISDKEVKTIVTFLKKQSLVTHNTEDIQKVTMPGKAIIEGEIDELFHEVVDFLLVKGKASPSMLQRQFRIGYNRAGRLMNDLEKRGIIGPEDGVKPRKVTITREEYSELYG